MSRTHTIKKTYNKWIKQNLRHNLRYKSTEYKKLYLKNNEPNFLGIIISDIEAAKLITKFNKKCFLSTVEAKSLSDWIFTNPENKNLLDNNILTDYLIKANKGNWQSCRTLLCTEYVNLYSSILNGRLLWTDSYHERVRFMHNKPWLCQTCHKYISVSIHAVLYRGFTCFGCDPLFLDEDFYKYESNGEKELRIAFKRNSIDFIPQMMFKSCYNPITKAKLKFDFYLPEINACVEFQGPQHFYLDKQLFKETIEEKQQSFEQQLYRDNIKRTWCKDQKINLFEITNINQINNLIIQLKNENN